MAHSLRFGELEVHPSLRHALLNGRPVVLGARAFDVLLALAERADRVVSKNELLDLAWPGLVVEENNLTVQISALRKALGTEAIATITGRGYRLSLGARPDQPPVAAAASRLERRLVALAHASVVGWARLLLREAAQAVNGWKALRHDLLEPSIKAQDGTLEELTPERIRLGFNSAVDAVNWALDLQRQLALRRGSGLNQNLHLRIGIVVDDAIVDDGKLLGMGTQAVAEAHEMAQHDEVLVTDVVRLFVADKQALSFLPVNLSERGAGMRTPTLWSVQGPDTTAGLAARAPARRLPSIAALPLQNLGALTDAYLATGLTEQVIAFLSLNKALSVIAHGSTLAFGGQDDAPRAARELGADYIVTGTLQRQGVHLHIDVTLSHVHQQAVVLRQPFKGSLGDVLGFQEQLAADIAAAIDPSVQAIETQQLSRRPTANPSAYDCLLRGLALMHDFANPQAQESAAEYFQQALALDTGYAQAHAQLAWWHNLRVGERSASHSQPNRQAALSHAQRALALDPRDAVVLANAGHIYAFLEKRFSEALALFDQALSLNPSCAIAWARSATTLAYLGQGDQAMQRVEQALRLSPQDPNRFAFLTTRGNAALVTGRTDEAVAWLGQALRLNPGYRAARRLIIAALVMNHETDQAKAHAEALLLVEPDFSVGQFGRWYPLQEPHLGRMLDALRQAGLPD